LIAIRRCAALIAASVALIDRPRSKDAAMIAAIMLKTRLMKHAQPGPKFLDRASSHL